MNDPDEFDPVVELTDRAQAKMRRGEEFDLEFETDFASLTDEERDDLVALMDERAAHGEEKLEALRENARVLRALLDVVESSGAPPGTTLWEAGQAGHIGVMEVIEAVRAVPDPLAD